jgi:hypothetical protein
LVDHQSLANMTTAFGADTLAKKAPNLQTQPQKQNQGEGKWTQLSLIYFLRPSNFSFLLALLGPQIIIF